MNATARQGGGRRRRPLATAAGGVVALDAARIERALPARERYKYVTPRVLPEGAGWKVVSPNCSRNVNRDGGEIDIAWLVPAGGAWQLHARDHANARWVLKAGGLTLADALDLLCRDSGRDFWV